MTETASADPTKRILLVEDNADDVELTLRALKKSNLLGDVVIARDGQQALDYLLGTGESAGVANPAPHVILLDLNLPRVDGLEVLRRLRGDPRLHFVPVVVLTTSTEESDLRRSYELGANSYIHKPVDYSQFAEATRALALYWLGLNVMPSRKGEPGKSR